MRGRSWFASRFSIVLGCLWSGCGTPQVPVTSGCVVGRPLDCLCDDGAHGERVCEGGELSECRCATLPVDASTDSAEAAPADADAAVRPDDSPTPDAASTADATVDRTCGTQSSEASIRPARSVDIVVIIDNSGSMSDEIEAVQNNINDNFARIIAESGADYRVIMLSHHGDSSLERICVSEPLSTTTCNPIPSQPQNGPRFFHYDFDIQSTDSWCRVLETYDTPDVHALAATGWREWLRAGALKVFVEISDDGISCTTSRGRFVAQATGDAQADALTLAVSFHDALLALSPEQFGSKAAPNYVWHSIIGVQANAAPELPWLPRDALQSGVCSGAYDPGLGYQMLSITSGGLRYPVCERTGFSAVFRAIAANVVQGSGVQCRFRIPDAPEGKFIERDSVRVSYAPSTGEPAEDLREAQAGQCNDVSFTLEGRDLVLCDAACSRIRTDNAARVNVVYACGEPADSIPLK